jgi:hypothetical protein
MKPGFVLPLALAFALLVAVPVSAAPPVIVTGTFEVDYPVELDPWPCPGIEIWDHEVGTYRLTSYFDNEGNLLRIQAHYLGVDNFYNPANPDIVLSGHFSGTGEIDPNTEELMLIRGAPYHITVPGYGTVLVRAGRWLQYPNGQVAGKNSLLDPKDVAQFCSLLAGD